MIVNDPYTFTFFYFTDVALECITYWSVGNMTQWVVQSERNAQLHCVVSLHSYAQNITHRYFALFKINLIFPCLYMCHKCIINSLYNTCTRTYLKNAFDVFRKIQMYILHLIQFSFIITSESIHQTHMQYHCSRSANSHISSATIID